ncbi:DEAD/DEAH box helicase [Pigmentiphaga aceris]|uniref:DEAD/DEAH box helicase n=1 Tax=Pigmentiphaga aceris TaxID=1940612 RepID=A0A5C0AYZ5_9BURK|nr:DEAD/DEAH box helicase [Pigmentiphaga aceris]QEI07682.1 DEAD/DEAH box helicase [Pigmentiphaga aceris]
MTSTPASSFDSLGLSAALLRAIAENAYATPTPIQIAAIPAILAGRDVQGAAQTGAGKTAAYCLPLLQRLAADDAPASKRRPVRALVLVPTRELAVQVQDTIARFVAHLSVSIKSIAVFGGVSINPQMMALRGGADLVVATPGRLLDLIDHNALSLEQVRTLVLDEADRMLDQGFADELADVLGLLPARRQNLCFSATFPASMQKLVAQLMHDPVVIDIPASELATPDIDQRAIQVDAERRTMLLRHLIATEKWSRVLVFVATKHGCDHVATKLRRADISAEPFHGELSQGKRTQVLADFKAGRVKVVIATDVAARGVDIAELPVVLNYDLPRSPVEYVHRIGRTGRAGKRGMAVTFVSADTEAHLRVIEKRQGMRLGREQVAGFEPEDVLTPQQDKAASDAATGGIKGKRPSKKDKLRAAAAAAAESGDA